MPHKVYPAAERAVIDIWHYTNETWGEKQADKYIRGLYEAIEKAADNKKIWKEIEHEKFHDIFYIRYERHYVFFRQLSKKTLGVVGILHERRNIPDRLKEDIRN